MKIGSNYPPRSALSVRRIASKCIHAASVPKKIPSGRMRNALVLLALLCALALPAWSGKCTGSATCTACSNCSSCKHCNAGGSCGVCASRGKTVAPTETRQVRCQAITQKGTQCKRMAQAGRNYCYQH